MVFPRGFHFVETFSSNGWLNRAIFWPSTFLLHVMKLHFFHWIMAVYLPISLTGFWLLFCRRLLRHRLRQRPLFTLVGPSNPSSRTPLPLWDSTTADLHRRRCVVQGMCCSWWIPALWDRRLVPLNHQRPSTIPVKTPVLYFCSLCCPFLFRLGHAPDLTWVALSGMLYGLWRRSIKWKKNSKRYGHF